MRFSLTRVVSAVVLVWALVSVCRRVAQRGHAGSGSGDGSRGGVSNAGARAATLGRGRLSSLRRRTTTAPITSMVYYVAQYTLAPRLVEKRTDLEFLIVARDAMRPGVDERIVGFEPVASVTGGPSRLQRRVK